MLFATPVMAQKKSEFTYQWEIASEIPADSGQTISPGLAGPVTGMHKDRLIIAGGANFPAAMPWEGGVKKYHSTAYVYYQKHGKLKCWPKTFKLPFSIAYAAVCSTPGGILYAGGENENGFSDKVWLMHWNEPSEEILFSEGPSLPAPVSNAAAALIGHTVYIAGGENSTQATTQLLAYDLENPAAGWKKLADIPQPVSHTVMTAFTGRTGNKIYLCGGRKKNTHGISDLYNNVFAYDVATNRWEEKKPLPYALSAGTGIYHESNGILLFGGDKGIVFHQTETLIAAIQAEKNPEKKQLLIQEKSQLQSAHPGFSREILRYDITSDTWTTAGTIPYETPVTTLAVKIKKGALIPSGEIRAGVRSPKILRIKLRPHR